MEVRYDPKTIEARWQSIWERDGAFKASRDAQGAKYYVLEMFPYPSGKIHMGHVRNYSIGDVLARFLTMRGCNVLHPMGWDSFGLPAENAAIQHGIHPANWTRENITNMKTQLKRMGLGYDWDREVATCLPDYYKWNQWIFLKLFEKGMAYKKRSSVNWCPSCLTVLANEQVEDGLCWRCSTIVDAKELEQWFLKITAYADELLDCTYKLPGWPEKVLVMQRNWIGRSEGAEVSFKVDGTDEAIKIFTTRPDTLYGVTFMSLAASHPLLAKITTAERKADVEAFAAKVKADRRVNRGAGEEIKEGVFTGAYCINPLNGDRAPVYAANFVLMEYGTGAVMAVPAHDQRDFEFAKTYGLPVRVVINPPSQTFDTDAMECAYADEGVMVNSGRFNGMKNTDAMKGIVKLLEEKGVGKGSITYKLRDWGISRQRYWGCPIPIVYCQACGAVPVPYNDLPVVLPEDVSFTGKGLSPLVESPGFIGVKCPKCGSKARRETDTMDTFVDSSWYFLRYCSPMATGLPFDKKDAEYWMPVDQYVGGIEHAVMHLLYARFFTKALRDLGLHGFDEPFTNLLTQGMVCKETQKCPEHGFLFPEEAAGGKCGRCGHPVEAGAVEKMSKSKKNVVDPDKIIEKYGADTTRLFSLFAAPPEKDLDWSADGVEGSYRFLGRVWRLVNENLSAVKGVKAYDPRPGGVLSSDAQDIRRITHETIKKVTHDIEERFHFNTAISAIMELVNALYIFNPCRDGASPEDAGLRVFMESLNAVVALLTPFAPHIAEELWEKLGHTTALHKARWPVYDEAALKRDSVLVVVQINGKVRGKINVPPGSTEDAVRGMALGDEKVKEWTRDKTLKKFVYVPNKLVSMVVS
ncbi:MAG: leucine--tRNA ligase [Deltaproteobacteria bacterium]|nr:leucine--tRNA ligase [Deltaproteobacteria bacterium]